MATLTSVVSGLDGAIGSDYRREENRLYFVEYASGALSRLDLVRDQAGVVSSGRARVQGTYRFDFDTGTHSGGAETADYDVFWRQYTDTERAMEPVGDAGLVALGPTNYGGLSSAELQAYRYGDDPLQGNVDGDNDLLEDHVFAVRTTAGNYAKVRVVEYGYNIELEWTTYELRDAYRVLGTGYSRPEDVVLAANADRAYVTERDGTLLEVDLTDADRAASTVLASGLDEPHQLAVDDAAGEAVVAAYGSGQLLQVDLTSGATTVLHDGLAGPVGVAVTADRSAAFVSEQGESRISRIDLGSGTRETVADGLDAPFFLTWADPEEDRLLFAERDPANRVRVLDLAADTVTAVADAPFRPSSVAVTRPGSLAVCADDAVATGELAGADYDASAPYLLGVGRIPVDYIADGYADTSSCDHDFVVADAPFGGTLPVKINHERAFADGYRYYRLLVDGEGPRQSWGDYKWSSSTRRFERETVSAMSGGYYPVRQPDDLWYDHWLGYRLDTRPFDNGRHTVTVEFYTRRNRNSASVADSVDLQIDNQRPRASIDRIVHHHETDGPTPVGTCGIV
jgi:DNA-binding beta-propeller fold protein YncE